MIKKTNIIVMDKIGIGFHINRDNSIFIFFYKNNHIIGMYDSEYNDLCSIWYECDKKMIKQYLKSIGMNNNKI